jgi:gliding motility-associated-like protein
MKNLSCYLLLVFLLLSSTLKAQVIENIILIKFQTSNTIQDFNQKAKQLENTYLSTISIDSFYCPFTIPSARLQSIYVLQLNENMPRAILEKLLEDKSTEIVEYAPSWDYFYSPNDLQTNQWSISKISGTQAWNLEKGDTNISIAIIDDAFLMTHQDLASQFWKNENEIAGNGMDDDGNGYIDDITGWDGASGDNDPSAVSSAMSGSPKRHTHGSHVAGIASGATHNNSGMASIGFNTRIMAIKTANDNYPYGLNFIGILTGMDYAIQNNANIISMSLGGGGYSSTFQSVINEAHDSGIVVIAAAGNNNNTSLMYPASYKNVISVASSDVNDSRSSFSTYNDSVDITSPGSSIYSCLVDNGNTTGYGTKSGTSMACPMTAGVAALMLSKNPYLSPDDIESCLKSSADNISTLNPSTAWGLGAGRLNAFDALKCVKAVLAEFSADKTLTCSSDSIQFYDSSKGSITSWQWSFIGGSPSSSTLENPKVVYPSNGTYNVKLVVSDGTESDSTEINNYISIADPTASLSSSSITIVQGQTAHIPITLTGNPPWNVKINDGINSYWINNIYSNLYYHSVSPNDTSIFSLDSITDGNCLGFVMDSVTVNVMDSNLVYSTCISLNPGPAEGKDAFLLSRLPTTPLPNYTDFYAMAWTFRGTPMTGRGVIDFDLSSIPTGAIIDSAFLSLYYNNTSGNSGHAGTNSSKLYRITSTWSESTVTWNNQPSYSTVNAVSLPSTTSTSQDFADIDVSPLIMDIWDNQSTSFGMLFKLDNESIYRAAKFATSDHANSAKWPEMEVCYTAPLETTFVLPCFNTSIRQKISDTDGNFSASFNNVDYFGTGIQRAGDLDSDGIEDLIVGASFADDGGSNRGKIYQLYMNRNGTVKSHQAISSTQGGFGTGIDNADRFGASITIIGDLDSDGVKDYAVSAHEDDDGGTNRGAIYILFMNSNGTVKSKQKLSDTDGNFSYTLNDYDFLGMGLEGIGDLDSDGNGDLAIGIHQDDDAGTNSGAICIVFLNSNGTVKSYKQITNGVNGFGNHLSPQDLFGISIEAIGDIDADGNMDIAVGAPQDDDGGGNRGAIYILNLNADGTVKNTNKISSIAGGLGNILSTSDHFGNSLSKYQDIDLDGIPELLVGANSDDDGGSNKGAVYLLKLNQSGNVTASKKISESTVDSLSLDNDDMFGLNVGALPDYDGDGYDDIVVGVGRDDDGGIDRGAVYILNLQDTCNIPCGITANFEASGSCLGDTILLTDLSNDSLGKQIISSKWIIGYDTLLSKTFLKYKFSSIGPKSITLISTSQNANLCSDTISKTIQIIDTLSVSLKQRDTICINDSARIDAPTVSCSEGPFTYTWSPNIDISQVNIPNPIISTKQDRIYTLVVTSSTGVSVSEDIAIKVDSTCCLSKSSFESIAESYCFRDSVLLNNTSESYGANPVYTWNILGDANFSSYVGPNPPKIAYASSGWKIIRLILSDACGQDTSSLSIHISPQTILPNISDTNLCLNDTLYLEADNQDSWQIESWGPPAAIRFSNGKPYTINDLIKQLYYKGSDQLSGCSDSVFFNIGIIPAPIVNLGADISSCDSLLVTPQTNATSFIWSTGQTTSSIYIANSGEYWLQAMKDGCTAYDTIIFNLKDAPSLTTRDSISCEDSILLSPVTNGTSFLWTSGETTSTTWANASGTYGLQVFKDGCSTKDSFIINISKWSPNLIQAEDTIFCGNNSTLTSQNIPTGATIIWNTGVTSPNTLSAGTSWHWIEVTNSTNCKARDSIYVNIEPSPNVSILGIPVICDSTFTTIEAVVDTYQDFVWSDGNSADLLRIIENTGKYSITVRNNTCTTSESIVITNKATPNIELDLDTFLCSDNFNEFVQLESNGNGNHLWSTGQSSKSINVYDPGTYSVTVSNECGSSTDSIEVLDKICSCDVWIPNSFSPNGDGLNDEFHIQTSDCNFEDVYYVIFNRLGVVVYKGASIDDSWDGTYDNRPALSGVYNLVLFYTTSNGRYSVRTYDREKIILVR